MNKISIDGGVYLVFDPGGDKEFLLHQLRRAVKSPVAAVQVWNNWVETASIDSLIADIIEVCRPRKIPVIINNDVSLLRTTGADGIHFDSVDLAAAALHQLLPFHIRGITCGNDLHAVRFAAQNKFDYISFCSMFPSPSATTCDLVDPDIIKQATEIFERAVFISGGVNPVNMLAIPVQANYNGVAVISGIMQAENPAARVDEYINSLKRRQ